MTVTRPRAGTKPTTIANARHHQVARVRPAAVYFAAGAVYVVASVFVPELLFSWFEGVPFLLLCVWAAHRFASRGR